MPVDQSAYRLVHYTNGAETVASILQYGFLLVPNKRFLINALLGEELFTDREPQEFGMVSFTQLPIDLATKHREKFGSFGIVVSWEWALAQQAQRVIYVDTQGPVAQTFAWLFRVAKQELDRATGGNVSPMTLTNKALAFMQPSAVYAHLLTLYEFMEPESNSGQVEWRIVNKMPQHHDITKPRSELIQELVAGIKMWRGLGAIAVQPDDVHAFICPREQKKNLQSLLPQAFSKIPVLTYRERSVTSRLGPARERALLSYRTRERVVLVEKEPPEDTIWLRRNRNAVYQLPEVGRLWGARFYDSQLFNQVRIAIQYQNTTGSLCEVVMPIMDALYLLNILKAMQHDSGLDQLNPSDHRGR